MLRPVAIRVTPRRHAAIRYVIVIMPLPLQRLLPLRALMPLMRYDADVATIDVSPPLFHCR